MHARPVLLLALVSLAASCTTGAPNPAGNIAGEAQPVSLGWRDDLTGEPDRPDVATTVAPISSLARNVGGDRIRLRGIVPDATNSHTFEPSPSDARQLANADIIVVNGLHLEEPTLALAEASKRPTTPIRLLGDTAVPREEWLFDFSFPVSEGDPNPHAWMSVRYARRYVELMAGWFAEADPANAPYYGSNAERLDGRLEELDGLIRQAVATVPPANRKLLTYHDSWAYWARDHGFEVVGAVQASDFSDPSPQDVARIIRQIRDERVPAVFGSEVFPSPVLEQIARESAARFVHELRDDEPPGPEGAPEHTYLGMLRKDMEVMVEALGGDAAVFEGFDVADAWTADPPPGS
jgi:manganese/iron transport system substrate-binding protein